MVGEADEFWELWLGLGCKYTAVPVMSDAFLAMFFMPCSFQAEKRPYQPLQQQR